MTRVLIESKENHDRILLGTVVPGDPWREVLAELRTAFVFAKVMTGIVKPGRATLPLHCRVA